MSTREASNQDMISVADFARNRQALATDPYRPLYHFSPPGFGMHDPAGLCYWQGKYHLFYLLTTPDVRWGRGHAVSDDLVNWEDMPMLPAGIRGGTGQAWVDKGRVILSLVGCIATASDSMLLDWTRHEPGPGGDNCIWSEGDYYYQCRANRSGNGTALEVLRSSDLMRWESLGNYLDDSAHTDPGTDCSCPNILHLENGKHLLLFFSHNQGPKYYIGSSDMHKARFTIESHGRMCYGPVMRGSLHAPTGFVDPSGRCIGMWNISECVRGDSFDGTKNGVMSLPRQLSVNRNAVTGGIDKQQLNPLMIKPIEELKKLRFDPVKLENVSIPANGEKTLNCLHGSAMELDVVIDPREASEVGLHVLRSPNSEERTTISLFMHSWAWPWKSDKREMMLDVSRASLSTEVVSRSPETGPLYLKEGEPLRLRIFIDRSIVEVFADDRQCLTLRAYPSRPDSTGVSVFARGGEANIVSLTAYQMRSIWS